MRSFISLLLTVLALTSSVFAAEQIVTEGTQTAQITGTTTLVKQGTGTYTLDRENTYSGGTRIEAGTLLFAAPKALGNGGTVAIQNGGTLKTSASAPDVRLQTTNLVINVQSGGTISYTKTSDQFRLYGSTLNVAAGATADFGILSVGTGAGAKDGSFVNINGGTMTSASNVLIGNDNENGTFTFASGAITATDRFTVGQYHGTGIYNQDGGTATIKNLIVGNGSENAIGTMNLTGGTLNVTNTTIGGVSGTNYGKGFISQTGGTFTTQNLTLGSSPNNLQTGQSDLIELSGGTLAVTTLTDSSDYFKMTDGKLVLQKNGSTNPSVSKNLTVEGGTVQVDGVLSVGGTYTQTGGELRLTDDGVDKISAGGFSFADTSLILETGKEYSVGRTLKLSDYLTTGGTKDFDFSKILIYGTNNFWGLTLGADGSMTIFADKQGLPEPSTWVLMALGLLLLKFRKKR